MAHINLPNVEWNSPRYAIDKRCDGRALRANIFAPCKGGAKLESQDFMTAYMVRVKGSGDEDSDVVVRCR